MKNNPLKKFKLLIGKWETTMTNAWFLKSMDVKVKGKASFEWLDNGLIIWRFGSTGKIPGATCVIGYSDKKEKYEVLYYDSRGVYRIFDMELKGNMWTMDRKDKDFYQRLEAVIKKDSIVSKALASDDKGRTWRKDFDLVYTRKRK